MSQTIWTQSNVHHGDKEGTKIGIPTLNLDTSTLPDNVTHGIYAALVRIDGKTYHGAGYIGPRLVFNESNIVFEIHLINSTVDAYHKTIEYRLLNFIRPEMNFDTPQDMKIQIEKDIAEIEKILLKEENTQ